MYLTSGGCTSINVLICPQQSIRRGKKKNARGLSKKDRNRNNDWVGNTETYLNAENFCLPEGDKRERGAKNKQSSLGVHCGVYITNPV